jgi:cytochrome c-type biogenesis protein CcmH/NrfG
MSYYMKNDYARAIADFEAVLRINPNDTDARQRLNEARARR